MLHFGLGTDTVIPRHDRDLAERPRADLREPGRRPALHGHRALGARRAPAPGAPPPARQFCGGGPAAGLELRRARRRSTRPPAAALIPLRLNRRGPGLAVGDASGSGPGRRRPRRHDPRPLADPRAPSAPGRFAVVRRLPWRRPPPSDDGPLLLFDADGRGRSDLLVTRGGNSLPAGSPGIPAAALPERRPRRLPARAGRTPSPAPDQRGRGRRRRLRPQRPARALHRRARPARPYPLAPRSALLPTAAAGSRMSPTPSPRGCGKSGW